MSSIQHIGIVGSGNVAHHLVQGFLDENMQIEWIMSRNATSGKQLANLHDIHFESSIPNKPVDLILLCVNDDSIPEVLKHIPNNQAIAYTSGTVPLEKLSRKENIGVFYPLQTFSKDKVVNLFEVPFFIEADNPTLQQQIFDLAWKLSRKVSFANSEQRGHLHLAAVYVNNFTNHLFHLAKEYVEEHELEWDYLLPLIQETVSKIETIAPKDAQTGPARRNDTHTIEEQLKKLSEQQKELYAIFTKSIQGTYKK